jgi:hypothetical protein
LLERHIARKEFQFCTVFVEECIYSLPGIGHHWTPPHFSHVSEYFFWLGVKLITQIHMGWRPYLKAHTIMSVRKKKIRVHGLSLFM